MKATAHILVSLIVGVISVAGIFGILTQVSPDESRGWPLILVYVLVFLAICALSAIAGVGIRMALFRTGARREYLRPANRQAVLFGAMAIIVLMLEAGRVFNLWSAGLLFIIFLLLELYIQ